MDNININFAEFNFYIDYTFYEKNQKNAQSID